MGFLIFLLIWIVIYFIIHMDDGKNTREDIYNLLKQNSNFTSMKTFAKSADKEVHLDTNSKQLAIINKSTQKVSVDYIPFSSVVECEILENNISIAKGGIGRAVVGGVVAGGVGAIVGSTTAKSSNYSESLSVRIVTNDLNTPLHVITYHSYKTKKDSSIYKNAFNDAQNLYASLTSIIKNNEATIFKASNQNPATTTSDTFSEQLRNLSKLHKEGILTDSEFESKKNQILSKI